MEVEPQSPAPWPLPVRIAVLCALMLYLGIVVLAPLTIPSGAPFLTEPIAKKLAPIHQALYLNHGYQFFAPNPGPSHVLVYEIEAADGQKTKGHFPDRDHTSPRLLYHRWFMLSESMYREYLSAPLKSEIDEARKKFDQQIAELTRQGKPEESEAMAAEKDKILAELVAEKVKFDALMLNLARRLVSRFGKRETSSSETSSPEISLPKSIRMWIRRRTQPLADQSKAGIKLTDERFVTQAEVAYFPA